MIQVAERADPAEEPLPATREDCAVARTRVVRRLSQSSSDDGNAMYRGGDIAPSNPAQPEGVRNERNVAH